MTIFAIIGTTRFFILDSKGFTDYERDSTQVLTKAFYDIDLARENIITQLEKEWAQLNDRGMVSKQGTSLDTAKIEIRTGMRGRIVFHDPAGENGNLYEIEYHIKRLSLN